MSWPPNVTAWTSWPPMSRPPRSAPSSPGPTGRSRPRRPGPSGSWACIRARTSAPRRPRPCSTRRSPQTRQLLRTLTGGHLLEETGRDRYQFHDLVRVYAAECARASEPEAQQAAAIRRLLTWYLHTADAFRRIFNPDNRHVLLDPPPPSCRPPAFTTHRQAWHWAESELANLVPALRQATTARRRRPGLEAPGHGHGHLRPARARGGHHPRAPLRPRRQPGSSVTAPPKPGSWPVSPRPTWTSASQMRPSSAARAPLRYPPRPATGTASGRHGT